MLEKIGLPAKPSMRGGNWVVDASHCQGCSSQFTFINRKHHCQRCGGLFCNSCTQQRMILRGQGDSPVRICDPCKKLEDAARFELRYGHKSRNVKETEGKQRFSSRGDPQSDMLSDLQRATSSASSSYIVDEVATPEGKGDVLKEMESKSPGELRQQAAEEKKRFRVLKGEGKSEAALQAFKRGKELERQAGALEIALRKTRRKASVLNKSASSQTENDAHEGSTGKKVAASQSTRVVKDDLLSELRELGWSDADLHDADKKPGNLSVEGELSNIIKEIPQKSNVGRVSGGIDNSQVLAHKRKALLLKREGKLAEAKEELKKAKLLEKQLEEQELLGQADDSDDDLSALIRSMDDDKQDDPLADYGHDLHVNLDHLSGPNDLVFDDNFDVTEDDTKDPEIVAALRSFGWSEEDDHMEEADSHSVLNREALESEVLSLKREALSQKHAGNPAEAMLLLKKAKLLEKDLETTVHQTSLQKKPMMHKSRRSSMSEVDDNNVTKMKDSDVRPKPKSKLLIQRELLDLKKKALALRREGRIDEADEELRKGKDLERQLQEMEDVQKLASTEADGIRKDREPDSGHQSISADLGFDEEATGDVTEADMCDPAMLSVLKNLGWVDDHVESASNKRVSSKQTNDACTQEARPSTIQAKVPRSKTEIQRELLGIKRKALALRRQGKTKEADDELEKAKSLEKQMAEMEIQYLPEPLEMKTDVSSNLISEEKSEALIPAVDLEGVVKASFMKNEFFKDQVNAMDIYDVGLKSGCATSMPPPAPSDRIMFGIPKLESSPTVVVDSQNKQVVFEQSITSSPSESGFDQMDFLPSDDRRSSLATILKPTNKESRGPAIPSLEHAGPELLADARVNVKCDQGESAGTLRVSTVDKIQTEISTMKQAPNDEANAAQVFNSPSDQILARKRQAVALKREGKLAEAREELRQAKLLEKSLEKHRHQVSETSQNSLGSTSSHSLGLSGGKHQKPMSGRDRFKLQQESLAHKRQALKLRREGRIEESDAELELAKTLEAQLEEIDSLNSNNKGVIDDAVVEGLLDPQLMSALKSIGWDESDITNHSQEKLAPKSITKNMNFSSEEKSEANSSIPKTANISPEKTTLEEQIKAEKLRAVNLKHAGKQAEALEALRTAKRLEKRLVSST